MSGGEKRQPFTHPFLTMSGPHAVASLSRSFAASACRGIFTIAAVVNTPFIFVPLFFAILRRQHAVTVRERVLGVSAKRSVNNSFDYPSPSVAANPGFPGMGANMRVFQDPPGKSSCLAISRFPFGVRSSVVAVGKKKKKEKMTKKKSTSKARMFRSSSPTRTLLV